MQENGNGQLPVRHIKRADIVARDTINEDPGLTGYDKVSLEEIRMFVADLRRRMNSLDAMLKRAQGMTTK